MKIRLMGTVEEIDLALIKLQQTFNVIYKSGLYANRGSDVIYRMYIEVKLK